MESPRVKTRKRPMFASIALCVVATVAILLGYAYFRIFTLSSKVTRLQAELATATRGLNEKTDTLAAEIGLVDQKALGLSDTLTAAEQNLASTTQYIASVQTQVGGLEKTVGNVSGTVTTLEKLTKTDPELLQKYSKVFFLNEHYAPERVSTIPKTYLYSEQNPDVIHALVLPHLARMLDAATAAGEKIYVKSAYRSYDEQKHLKAAYRVTFGEGTANTFSADQGYSEHQLGTTVDLITTGLGGQLEGFDKTTAYAWMLANGYRYGFTLSYPQNNGYYIFEPWHWRFVGIKLATYLHNQNEHFYGLDQRKIDEYLIYFDE